MGLLLAGISASFAATGLVPQWPDAGHRFHLGAYVELPSPMRLLAEQDAEVLVDAFQVDLVTACRPAAVQPKKGSHVDCLVEDVTFRLRSAQPKHLQAIADEMDAAVTGKTVQLQVSPEGRVRNLDLDGLDERDQRHRTIAESERLMLARAFALIDLELPKGGDDQGRPWRANDVLAVAFPSNVGTMGSVPVELAVGGVDGSVASVALRGKGIVMSGETVAVGGGESRPRFTWEVTLSGEAQFDVSSGRLISRKHTVEGVPTASSTDANAGRPYRQVAALRGLGAGERPELPASGPLP